MKTVVIALLDKTWPPAHSFVDGMLASVAATEPDLVVRLCVSRTEGGGSETRRYHRAACLPRLYPRRGIWRLMNFPVASALIARQALRERDRGHRVVLFVRNDPILLLAASLLRHLVDRLVFQSSFPHEECSGWFLKRWMARKIYLLASRGVDTVTGVSPEGVDRAGRLCPAAEKGHYIPLLSDLPWVSRNLPGNNEKSKPQIPTFIYIGTHGQSRELNVVLQAIVFALGNKINAKFWFVGASAEDEARLSTVPGVANLIDKGLIIFDRPLSRYELPRILSLSDVGISLIPPKTIYYESSPTKLAEYMGAGLAILASKGIPMQERFVKESDAGILVDWDVVSIASGIQTLCSDKEMRLRCGENAAEFAHRSLQYSNYISQFRQLLSV
jgi:glycosyltransferase involved in cell wall biosynthesis